MQKMGNQSKKSNHPHPFLFFIYDMLESHCFQPSPYFCGQFLATKQRQKIIELDYPIISTIVGFKEERTVHIMAEESVYLKKKKIRLLSIDRLLEGEPPVS